jgi:hypothetical protein
MSEQSASNTTPASTAPFYAAEPDERSRLFFRRRRPHWSFARDWVRPPEPEYQKGLAAEGFITDELTQKKLGQSISDDLRIELRELDQHLLPHFWQLDQAAKYYQNRHFLFQWTFIISAFLTTALAAASVFVYAKDWEGTTGLVPGAFGLGTAIVSAVAAAVSYLDANQTPQRRWFQARAQAESLRSLYFLFIARQPPFDTPSTRERVETMRQRVVEVLTEKTAPDRRASEKDKPQRPPTPPPPEPKPEDPADEEESR